MSAVQRRRTRQSLVVGLSLLLHLAVFGWLADSASPNFFGNEPVPVTMSVDLVRPRRFDVTPANTPERRALARDEMPTLEQSASDGGVQFAPPSPSAVTTLGGSPGSTAANAPSSSKLQAALHTSTSCTNAGARLSRDERDKCLEKLGRLSASAPSYDAPIDPAKRAYFDEVAAAGPSGSVVRDAAPGAMTPGSASVSFFKCSVPFGIGRKPKDREGTVRLGKSPCAIPLQGSFFTPEASVRKR